MVKIVHGILTILFIYNHGQKSWDKFTFVAFFTRAKRTARREFIYVCSAPPPPPPLQCWTPVHAIFLEVQHCIGGGGGRGESNAF